MEPSLTPSTLDTAPPPASRLWWLVPIVAFLLLVVVAMIVPPPTDTTGKGNSYDASDAGFRAAYLILDELKFPVERSRMAVGGSVRWVLDPTETLEQDIANLDSWIRRGGIALLATESQEFATRLGLTIQTKQGGGTVSVDGLDVKTLNVGETRVELIGTTGDQWDGVREGKKALVTIIPHGDGEIWFLHRPAVLRNGPMRQADNAVFAARLASAMLAEHPGTLSFDEYCHGLRDRPTMTALLLRPPMLPVTIQVLALSLLVLWAVAPRFGPLRPLSPPNRRSKEEYLDAVAELLRRKGDFADAFRAVQADFRRRLEASLGCPAGLSDENLANEAERRRGVPADLTRRWLAASAPPGGAGSAAFLDALHQLDKLRHEFFDRPRTGR